MTTVRTRWKDHASNYRHPRRRVDTAASGAAHATAGSAGARGNLAPADHGNAGGHMHGAGDIHDGRLAARSRHRRQWLAVPRSHGNLVMAPVEQAGEWRQNLGHRQAPRSVVYVGQSVLVV